MKAAQPKTALMLRVPPAIHEQIRLQAEAQGISMTEWVTRCVEECLARKSAPATGESRSARADERTGT